MPMAAMFSTVNPAFSIASVATPSWVLQISVASCSTQPGLGRIWVNSFFAVEMMYPFLSKMIARELVVPWSNERMYFDMCWMSFSELQFCKVVRVICDDAIDSHRLQSFHVFQIIDGPWYQFHSFLVTGIEQGRGDDGVVRAEHLRLITQVSNNLVERPLFSAADQYCRYYAWVFLMDVGQRPEVE